jgi:uncharacterized FlaG/YvyC family protein
MITKIENTSIPAALPARPVERPVAGEAEPKTDPVQEKAAAVRTYDFQFRVNPETDEITAVIVDPETRAVIREVPSKEMRAASDVIRSLIGPRLNKVV